MKQIFDSAMSEYMEYVPVHEVLEYVDLRVKDVALNTAIKKVIERYPYRFNLMIKYDILNQFHWNQWDTEFFPRFTNSLVEDTMLKLLVKCLQDVGYYSEDNNYFVEPWSRPNMITPELVYTCSKRLEQLDVDSYRLKLEVLNLPHTVDVPKAYISNHNTEYNTYLDMLLPFDLSHNTLRFFTFIFFNTNYYGYYDRDRISRSLLVALYLNQWKQFLDDME